MTTPKSDDATKQNAALWERVNAAIDDGSLDRAAWVEALREEKALADEDPRIDLEAMLVQGLKLGFIRDVDEASKLLKG